MEKQKSKFEKKRKPIIALLLSILSPGLGHIYVGKLKKGIILRFIIEFIILILIFGGIFSTFKGLILVLCIDVILSIIIMFDSIIIAKKTDNPILKSYNRWYYYIAFYILFCCISFVSLTISKITHRTYQITSISMENTLLKDDFVFCDKRYYKKHKIQQTDLIIYEFNESEKQVVHRVVGLSYDKIEIVDKIVYVNNEIYMQEFAKFIDSRIIPKDYGNIYWDNEFFGSKDNFGPIIVPENQYFVLGDNFDVSGDSRYWGCVQKDKIIGKPIYIYFSYGEEPINDFKEYMNLSLNRKREIRKSRIGKQVD